MMTQKNEIETHRLKIGDRNNTCEFWNVGGEILLSNSNTYNPLEFPQSAICYQ